ncbi:MAG TPA: peptidase domain-containing ABC transporter [Chitinophaga sp.]|uniref:peptidase domain-containing ABC transporter n=1 Tax=Chitinophaga sp. TaxID=1869181 RepID=UPI002DB9F0C7|nr:peptidase domain-containing ABC transporter [Chitinophaga sp.]HEU4555524.1 peptidase domain-containing ABC transporter [Chitinophaga sp.]
MLKQFPHYRQHDEMDCGPACLRIIGKYYGRLFSLEYLRELCHTSRAGSSLLSLSEAAEELGFRTAGMRLTYHDLAADQPFPCIAYWNQRHFIVVYRIKGKKVYASDPAHGRIIYTQEEFMKGWATTDTSGIILSLQPSAALEANTAAAPENTGSLRFIYKYLRQYRGFIGWLLLVLLAGSLLQMAFPFLTQGIVDTGIRKKNLPFIYIMLLAQLLLFAGKTIAGIIQGYMLLHLGNRINLQLLSDFFKKLMKLPLGYFDVKMAGDILQRINDHQRVEGFMTSGVLNMLFAVFNLLVFGIVLIIYNPLIFVVFAVFSILYFSWISFFMKRRATLDYKRFNQLTKNNEQHLELIYGMQEIKLHNAESKKRGQWEQHQLKLFATNLTSLKIGQLQSGGAAMINELKNILISFLAARLVLQGHMSLGVMLSVSYITGQLNIPVLQLSDFFKSWQDARLSLNRINEIHQRPDEEAFQPENNAVVPAGDIHIQQLCFRYEKCTRAPMVLQDINLLIPRHKITAIVGDSGSGKTTLLKLLLRFYEPESGNIAIAGQPLTAIPHSRWREKCGVVMQEGYLFNDSIEHNIAVGATEINRERLAYAAHIANIHGFIASLPLGYQTRIGQSGAGLSTGQKQRLLIARAVYKNPEVLFFDEATSALDARNERVIIENLNNFFEGRTVVVIAHRLSTVKHADKIIVMERGRIVETGNHQQLISERGCYYNLVKNQLELGK